MTFESTIALAFAMLVLAASPGPGVLATVAQALSGGARSSVNVIAGIITGDLVFLLLAVFGMSAVARIMGGLFFVVKLAGSAYLIWMGFRIWRSASVRMEDAQNVAQGKTGWQRFACGLFLTLGNPKAICFYMGFLPNFMELERLSMADIGIAAGVVSLVLAGVLGIYAWTASGMRRAFKSTRAMQNLNRSAGAVMIGTGAMIAVR